MRRLLVDHARGKMAQKRGSDAPRVVVSEGFHDRMQPSMDAAELIDLDRALDELAAEAPRLARLVELQFFSGLENVPHGLDITLDPAMAVWQPFAVFLEPPVGPARVAFAAAGDSTFAWQA